MILKNCSYTEYVLQANLKAKLSLQLNFLKLQPVLPF